MVSSKEYIAIQQKDGRRSTFMPPFDVLSKGTQRAMATSRKQTAAKKATKVAAKKRSPGDRNQGRKKLAEGQTTHPFVLRIPAKLHAKLLRLAGGKGKAAAWLRRIIEDAEES
jgi:hypothetical protein